MNRCPGGVVEFGGPGRRAGRVPRLGSDGRAVDREARDLAGSCVIAGLDVSRCLSTPPQIVRYSADERLTGRTPDGRDFFVPKHRRCPAMSTGRPDRCRDCVADSPPKSGVVGAGCHSVRHSGRCGTRAGHTGTPYRSYGSRRSGRGRILAQCTTLRVTVNVS